MSAKLKLNNNVGGSTSLVCDDSQATDEVVVLPSGGGTLVNEASVIGINQTWQDMTASRVDGQDYVNDTGKPIMISMRVLPPADTTIAHVSLLIGTLSIALVGRQSGSDRNYYQLSGIIPNGAVYSYLSTGSPVVSAIRELR